MWLPAPALLLMLMLQLLPLLAKAGTPSQDGIAPMNAGLHLIWEGISFQVSKKLSGASLHRRDRSREQERILTNVSGEALPGRLLAIMGPSGSGKSSLLNVLSGRVPAARSTLLEGWVEVGGIPLQDFDTQRYMAYVKQQQDFYPFLTVKETLLIDAGLRLGRDVSSTEKESIVWGIMERLGLSRAADTLVGDLRTPGISGGEKRRLAMGMQLIGLESPSLIFLDEPTSGLDSHQALQVMEAVRGLREEGHTVVVAIHQPRSSIYALFDDILLLSDGAVMYHGATEAVLPWLASLGHKCPPNFNPADFMVDLISPDTSDVSGTGSLQGHVDAAKARALSLERMAKAANNDWEAKSKCSDRPARQIFPQDGTRRLRGKGNGGEADQMIRALDNGGDRPFALTEAPAAFGGAAPVTSRPVWACTAVSAEPSGTRRARSGWVTQFKLLLKRSWRQATRDKFAAVARVGLGFGLGSIFGSIFWKLGLQESSIQNRVSLFVNIAMNTAMIGCIRALQTLAVERRVVAMERMDQGYSASAYLSSKILAELPMDTVFPTIFGTTIYFAAGLNAPVGGILKFAKFLGTILVHAHASSALGLMVGCLSPSTEVANLLGPALIVVSLLLSGVHDNIPPFLRKLEAVCTMKWGVQSIVTNEMRDIKFVPDGKRMLLGWKLSTDKGVIPGDTVMEKMGFKGEGLAKPTRRLLQLTAGFHAVTLLNLIVGTSRFQRLEEKSTSDSSFSDSRNAQDEANNRSMDGWVDGWI